MDQRYPIFTTETQCQDCYKCVRECPVKAIRIAKNHASILPELCISCGRCVSVCPVQAKTVRDDTGRADMLLQSGQRVIASIAPSWICEFPGVSAESFIEALQSLGFSGASETALGAEAISQETNELCMHSPRNFLISSACPVVVEWIKKYQCSLVDHITGLVSPAVAHARMLHREYGKDVKVVFIGPCVAKKLEADQLSEDISLALTFRDLRSMLRRRKILFSSSPSSSIDWLMGSSHRGNLYPAEGGMIRTITVPDNTEVIAVSGIQDIQRDILGMNEASGHRRVFLEALACSGGCIHGPGMSLKHESGLERKLKILSQQGTLRDERVQQQLVLLHHYAAGPVERPKFSDQQVEDALKKVDKHAESDELNCGGCGYETCRDFAVAVLSRKAEPGMCVSYMRNKAQRKANALLRSIPLGVVIVDKELRIIESNKPFALMFDEDTRYIYETFGTLEKALLSKILPFADLFSLVLTSGTDICREHFVSRKQVFNLTIFSIQPGEVVGGVIHDVTDVQWRRQQIAQNAQEVLRRNLAVVQEIAHKLGEHMADNEVLLNSIAYSYQDETTHRKQL